MGPAAGRSVHYHVVYLGRAHSQREASKPGSILRGQVSVMARPTKNGGNLGICSMGCVLMGDSVGFCFTRENAGQRRLPSAPSNDTDEQ